MPESHYLRTVLLALSISASVLTQTQTVVSAFIAGATATDVNATSGVKAGGADQTPESAEEIIRLRGGALGRA